MQEISFEDFSKLKKNSYVLIDIRDEGLRNYGMIPGAVAIDFDRDSEEIRADIEKLPEGKTCILYCEIGRRTKEFDEEQFPEGREYYSLEGGYIGYVRALLANENDAEEKQKKAE